MQRSEQINELATAMAKAQGQFPHAAKDSTNPHFRSKYADLAAVLDVIRKPLSDNGLAVMQPVKVVEGGVEVETWVLHTSGQWCMETTFMPTPENANPQQNGSATTYARRYGLNGMFCLAAEDDDGNAASEAPPQDRRARKEVRVKITPDDLSAIHASGDVAAGRGYEDFRAWWAKLTPDEKTAISPTKIEEWRQIATVKDSNSTEPLQEDSEAS